MRACLHVCVSVCLFGICTAWFIVVPLRFRKRGMMGKVAYSSSEYEEPDESSEITSTSGILLRTRKQKHLHLALSLSL